MNVFAGLVYLSPVLFWILTVGAVYSLSICVFNIWFHPLREFKGPLLWRMSRLPFCISMMRGHLPYQVKRFHDQYGPVVRLAPDELSFLDGWTDIYAARYLDRPSQWRVRPPGQNVDNLISADRAQHARMKRAIAPGFNSQAVEKQADLVSMYCARLVTKCQDAIKKSGSGAATVEISKWISYATFDLIGEIAWSRQLNCLENEKYQMWMTALFQYQATLFAVVANYFPPLDKLLLFIIPPSALAALRTIMSIAKSNVEYAMTAENGRPDIMAAVANFNKTHPEKAMSREELEANSTIFVLAGTEPVSNALIASLQMLLLHPSRLSKLLAEIRSSFRTESDINPSTVNGLSYLDACIKETLRVCPPFPDSIRRFLDEDTVISGTHVPKGTTVASAGWATCRSAALWRSPDDFVPERWLRAANELGDARVQNQVLDTSQQKDTPDLYIQDRRSAFHPFGLGARACPGQLMAWLQMRMFLVHVLWKFDIGVSSEHGVPIWADQRIFWQWLREDFRIELQVRDI